MAVDHREWQRRIYRGFSVCAVWVQVPDETYTSSLFHAVWNSLPRTVLEQHWQCLAQDNRHTITACEVRNLQRHKSACVILSSMSDSGCDPRTLITHTQVVNWSRVAVYLLGIVVYHVRMRTRIFVCLIRWYRQWLQWIIMTNRRALFVVISVGRSYLSNYLPTALSAPWSVQRDSNADKSPRDITTYHVHMAYE